MPPLLGVLTVLKWVPKSTLPSFGQSCHLSAGFGLGFLMLEYFLLLCFQMQFWPWQYEPFDAMVVNVALEQQSPVQWVDVSGGMVANVQLASFVKNVTLARAVGHVEDSCFRGPDSCLPVLV